MLTDSVYQTVWTKLDFEKVWQDLLTSPEDVSRAEMFKGGDCLTFGFLCILVKHKSCPLNLLEKVFDIASRDEQKRNIASFRNREQLLPLHVALKNNQPLELIQMLVRQYPEALLEHIPPPSSDTEDNSNNNNIETYLDDYLLPSTFCFKMEGLKSPLTRYLKSVQKSYFAYLIRINFILSINAMSRPVLFDGKDIPIFSNNKGESGMKSKRAYFAYSVLRWMNDRGMELLAKEVYSYIGCNQNGPGIMLCDAKNKCPFDRLCEKKVRKIKRKKDKEKFERQRRIKEEVRRKEEAFKQHFEQLTKEGKMSRKIASKEACRMAGISENPTYY